MQTFAIAADFNPYVESSPYQKDALVRLSDCQFITKQYKQALKEALDAGYYLMENGGTALDAVEVAVKTLEDTPLFNAGKGAVFTADKVLNEQGKSTSKGNKSYHCPSCSHPKRKLEVNFNKESKTYTYFNCWTCGFKSKSLLPLFKKINPFCFSLSNMIVCNIR